MQVQLSRLVDANANRAREALRCLEDSARFLLDHARLAAAFKEARHDLARHLDDAWPDLRGLAARDTRGDVGTQLTGAGEYERSGAPAVVRAAGLRLGEALRTIEEFTKIRRPDVASAIERIRYRCYDLESELVLALPRRGVQWRLCVLITEALCTLPWTEVVREAIEGGADCIQLREKDLPDRELLARAQALVEISRRRADVVINDRVDIALLCGATGVHLGQTDLTVRDARRLAGDDLVVGVSTGSLSEARSAAAEGADIIGVGPMFHTTTKPKDQLAGPSLVESVAKADPPLPPHLAIGGITPENIHLLGAAGCRGVAVSAAVCGAEDPRTVCASLVDALGSAREGCSR